MGNEIARTDDSVVEQVVIGGDLSRLTPEQRVNYYRAVCDSLGLNPLTKPFEYIQLNGRLTLYARKDATDQLRRVHNVSIVDVQVKESDSDFIVTAHGMTLDGRSDVEIGVVSKKDMRGDYGNALMKAVTKAKRRLTLSMCGLGMLDETEIETVPGAIPVKVDDEGEIMSPITVTEPIDVPDEPEHAMTYETACAVTNRDGERYGDIPTDKLSFMLRSIEKRIRENHLEPDEKDALEMKRDAIIVIIRHRREVGE